MNLVWTSWMQRIELTPLVFGPNKMKKLGQPATRVPR